MQRILLVVLLLLAGVMILAWSWTARAPIETQASAPPTSPASAPGSSPSASEVEPPSPAPAKPESQVDLKAGDNDRKPSELQVQDFAKKYHGWSSERLEGAKAELSKIMLNQFNEVLKRRMSAGQYEELVLKEGEPTPQFSEPAMVSGESAGPGLVRHKIARVPLDEYPELQALKAEVDWLVNRTYELSKPPGR